MKFKQILQEYNIPFKDFGLHHHVTEGWINIDCPFCSKNSYRFRMGYNLSKLYTNCWTCGSHSAIETLMEITSEPYKVISNLVGKIDREFVKSHAANNKLILPKNLGELQPAHKRYLEKRGLDPQEIQQLWGIKGIGVDSKLPWSIFIPVNINQEIVSWTTRSISDKGKRYKSAPAEHEKISIKSVLLGEDYATHSIIVVEGPFDCFKIGHGAVCTFGITYTRNQILKISQYPKRVICFDSEKAAQQQAHRLCVSLSQFPGTTVNVVLDAKDAGSASPREIRELRKRYVNK